MSVKFTNNAFGTLATAISASDTGIVLATGNGSRFPTLAAGDYFYATLVSTAGTQEIVKATARVGDTLTIVRAQDGTTAASFAAGALFELRVTAAAVQDVANELVAPGGSALVSYLPAGAGAVVTTVQTKLRENASVKDFGAVGDGVTDDTVAINLAIAAINASQIRGLFFPAGTYLISSALDAFTASAWAVYGSGIETTRLLMSASAGTNGTFFTVGTATIRPSVWYLGGFDMFHNNHLSLNGVGNAIECPNCAQGIIENVKSWRCNGLVTFGRTAFGGTSCNSLNISNSRCISHAPAGGKAIDLQSFAGGKLVSCGFSAAQTASPSFRGLYAHPSAVDTADTMKFVNCEWNYPLPNPLYNIEYDGTNNSLGNQQFVNCVFDQAAGGANIYAHIDGSPSANAKLGLYFDNCISNASTNASAIIVDNTGNKPFSLSWVGGQLTQFGNGGKVLTVTNSNNAYVMLNSVYILSRSSGSPVSAIYIGDACKGVNIVNCRVSADYSNSDTGAPASPFQYFVTFEGSATNCRIENNDCTNGATDLIQWIAQPTTGLETLKIANNFGVVSRFPFSKTATGGTSATAYTYAIPENKIVTLKAKVMGRHSQNTLLTRCYYETTVVAYRPTGLSASVQGTVTPISIESGVPLNAEWSLSTNNLSLIVTTTAAQTTDFYFDVVLNES